MTRMLFICRGHDACQLKNEGYDRFGFLIGMGSANLWSIHRIYGGDFDGKPHLLMEYAGRPENVLAGCWGFRS